MEVHDPWYSEFLIVSGEYDENGSLLPLKNFFFFFNRDCGASCSTLWSICSISNGGRSHCLPSVGLL